MQPDLSVITIPFKPLEWDGNNKNYAMINSGDGRSSGRHLIGLRAVCG